MRTFNVDAISVYIHNKLFVEVDLRSTNSQDDFSFPGIGIVKAKYLTVLHAVNYKS